MDINIKNFIKSLTSKNGMTLTQLAELLQEKTGKHYTLASLTSKMKIKSLSLYEAAIISEILGYKIKFCKKSSDGWEEIFFP